MSKPLFFIVLLLSVRLVPPIASFSSIITSLSKGSSLSTAQDTVISSPNSDYTAGFHPVGENAYSFAIWFNNTLGDDKNYTIVWMANRDEPVNGRYSKLSLLKSGDLVLTDVGQRTVWASETQTNASVELELLDSGNLVLTDKTTIFWQSFDTPTDTLLPGQVLTKNSKLVSLRSLTNSSSGFYKLHFSDDNVLQLVYEGLEMSSVYWPSPWKTNWDNGRSTYNNSKIAVLDRLGHFKSTDNFEANTSDFGEGGIKRRLTLDIDGNIRVYSLDKLGTNWKVSWQAFSQPCRIHGICGLNSLCTYSHDSGRKCTCLQNHKMKNLTDWSYGCEPAFTLSCDANMVDFQQLRHVEFVGYDIKKISNYTLEQCKEECSHNCICKGFQFKYDEKNGTYSCFPKTLLFNGYRSPSWKDTIYVKMPKVDHNLYEGRPIGKLHCERTHQVLLERSYKRKEQHGWLKTFIGFIAALGVFEFIFLVSYLIINLKCSTATSDQVYIPVVDRFKRFTYAELKEATSNFRVEIGQGSGGVVYKGKLSDNRIAAVKCLKLLEANQGEAEFLAEVSTICNLNHMNLIDIWGYCAEGKHRLLVYEYMEHGSLADNLHASNILDWEKRFKIALGTAKGLAYLHEECLEWVLHCDVKPQNILLDSTYEPKVADFGLSKLLNRGGVGNSSFSTIRGTRGYMAPEWIFHNPITSKVDVYSYGIVLLELITGKSPNRPQFNMDNEEMQYTMLVNWVLEKMHGVEQSASQIQEVVDLALDCNYSLEKVKVLIKVALQCSKEDKDARPTMSQVVDILLEQEGSTVHKAPSMCGIQGRIGPLESI